LSCKWDTQFGKVRWCQAIQTAVNCGCNSELDAFRMSNQCSSCLLVYVKPLSHFQELVTTRAAALRTYWNSSITNFSSSAILLKGCSSRSTRLPSRRIVVTNNRVYHPWAFRHSLKWSIQYNTIQYNNRSIKVDRTQLSNKTY